MGAYRVSRSPCSSPSLRVTLDEDVCRRWGAERCVSSALSICCTLGVGPSGTAAAFAAIAAAATVGATGRVCSCEQPEAPERRPRWSEKTSAPAVKANDAEPMRAELVRAIRSDDARRSLGLMRELLPGVDAACTAVGETSLCLACAAGSVTVISALLRAGASPMATNCRGETCVAVACAEGQVVSLNRLAEIHGIDFSRPDNFGRAPIHKALINRHFEVVQRLLDLRVCPNLATSEALPEVDEICGRNEGKLAMPGQAPLHVVARTLSSLEWCRTTKRPRYQAMELLLAYGADPLLGDAAGDTPLHLCARQGDLAGLWLLVVEMPDPAAATQARNAAGVTVLQEADGWGLDAGIVVRLATWLPRGARRYAMSWVFWDSWAVFRTPYAHRS